MGGVGIGRARWPVHALILVYLILQLSLPLRGLIRDKMETRGHFSWNMYAQQYACRVRYVLATPDAAPRGIDYRSHFRRPEAASMVFHRDVLPGFHATLCEQFAARHERFAIVGEVDCRLGSDPELLPLVARTDICSAPNFGVLE